MKKSIEKLLATLSEQQAAVIRWVLNDKGCLELLARAGCGKTFTLLKVVEAIAMMNLGDVALMAFNKSIAIEIKGKLEAAGFDWKQAQAGTSHSFGFNAWRKVSPAVKVDDKKIANIIANFAITEAPSRQFDPNIWSERDSVIARLVSLGKQRALGHLDSIDNNSAWFDIWEHYDLENDSSELFTPDEIIECAKKVYKVSLRQCRDVIDFDDMILAPLVFKARFWPKDWILIDESQDTNPARRALALAMLKPKTGRVIFVGDDKQAINGFAGADNDAMLQLKTILSAKTLLLNVTRRCPKAVVAEAKKLVPDFTAHEDAIEGAVSVIDYDALLSQSLTKDDAILCRNTAPLIETAYMLLSKGVACRVEGRDIGNGLIKLAQRWKLKTLDKLLDKLQDYQDRQTAKFMSKGQEERIERLVDQLDCLRVIINRQLSLKKHGVDELVEDIKSMFGNTPDGEQPKVLTLSTVHNSKGREWNRVFALGRQKFMPSPYAKKDWQLEQEYNLEYVLITRAAVEFVDVIMPSKQK